VIGDRHVGIYASRDNWRTCLFIYLFIIFICLFYLINVNLFHLLIFSSIKLSFPPSTPHQCCHLATLLIQLWLLMLCALQTLILYCIIAIF